MGWLVLQGVLCSLHKVHFKRQFPKKIICHYIVPNRSDLHSSSEHKGTYLYISVHPLKAHTTTTLSLTHIQGTFKFLVARTFNGQKEV